MIDVNLTKRLAELSKIAFSDEELQSITRDMVEIINLMDKIKDIEVKEESYRIEAVKYKDLREDFAKESCDTEKILENAKKVKKGSFVVPKVV